MRLSSNPFNAPFRIFLLTALLACTGIVMIYSASGFYARNQQRIALSKRILNNLVAEGLAEHPEYENAAPEKRKEIREEITKRRQSLARKMTAEQLAHDHRYHSAGLLIRQILWFGLGLILLFVVYSIDYRRWKDAGPWLLVLSLFLLVLVFVPGIARPRFDHNRWIGVGGFTFQPSEFAKIALIIYMARMLTDHHDKITRSFLHGVAPALVLTSVFILAIIAEPDIGAAAVLTAIVFLMWFIGGMRIRHLAALVAAVIPAFVYVILMFPDRVERIIAFLRPTEENLKGKGWQLMHSLIAVGSGGLTGAGLGNSAQKNTLTEQYSEFIFSIISEELGFIGAALIIFSFFLLVWEGWRIALRAPDFYANLLASGITLMLAISVLLNLMVVLGLAPTKGLSLPLLSYGGSNLLVTMAAVGILMNIGKYVERQKETAVPKTPRARNPERALRRKRRDLKRKWYEREIA